MKSEIAANILFLALKWVEMTQNLKKVYVIDFVPHHRCHCGYEKHYNFIGKKCFCYDHSRQFSTDYTLNIL